MPSLPIHPHWTALPLELCHQILTAYGATTLLDILTAPTDRCFDTLQIYRLKLKLLAEYRPDIWGEIFKLLDRQIVLLEREKKVEQCDDICQRYNAELRCCSACEHRRKRKVKELEITRSNLEMTWRMRGWGVKEREGGLDWAGTRAGR